MRTVEVEITEILQKKVRVQIPEYAAETDAISLVEEEYEKSRLVLGYQDFVDVSFGIAN